MRKIIVCSDDCHSNPVSMQILLAHDIKSKEYVVSKKDVQKKSMVIKVADHRKISEIQKEFNDFFPFLKLEFFLRPHGKREGSERLYRIDCSKKISGRT
jgi:hypothetical protein